jgi:hypothetical protein
MMKFKDVALSEASAEAKVAALALLLDKELPTLAEHVIEVEKLQGPQGIQGPKGDKGVDGKDGINGKDGKDGLNGKDGVDGKDGDKGVSVIEAKIDFDDSLILTLSDGKELNVGEVRGEKGERGPPGLTQTNIYGGSENLDGGFYNSIYGGVPIVDGGTP